MNKSDHYLSFPNGQKMPKLGMGTYGMTKEEDTTNFVRAIVEFGYRHIDTASHYGNEKFVGEALKQVFAAGIKREELFITTKLWNTDHDIAEDALKRSLDALQLDYVDLYLIHWPIATKIENGIDVLVKIPLHVTWRDMEKNVKKGLARSIGVCNFNFQLLNDLISYAEIMPAANQIELHPYFVQSNFVEWMKSVNIQPLAYSPLGSNYLLPDDTYNVLKSEEIRKIAERYNKTVGQIILNWGMARGHAVIPKSSNPGRLKENIESLSFTLLPEDVDAITALDKNYRIVGVIYKADFLTLPMYE
jgi:alcohol dehydrogenase (NADP+)